MNIFVLFLVTLFFTVSGNAQNATFEKWLNYLFIIIIIRLMFKRDVNLEVILQMFSLVNQQGFPHSIHLVQLVQPPLKSTIATEKPFPPCCFFLRFVKAACSSHSKRCCLMHQTVKEKKKRLRIELVKVEAWEKWILRTKDIIFLRKSAILENSCQLQYRWSGHKVARIYLYSLQARWGQCWHR